MHASLSGGYADRHAAARRVRSRLGRAEEAITVVGIGACCNAKRQVQPEPGGGDQHGL